MNDKYHGMSPFRFWFIVLGMGIAGQLCWNMENQWFNTFVYAKIGANVNIVTAMVIVSALVTTISTFIFGTLSDRQGKRKKFVSIGYVIWGIATILFGLTEFASKSDIGALAALSGFLVVLTDAIMSFFGSMGCDSGYNVWLNDYTNDKNKGQVGAALAALPVLGTVVGTVLGGILVNIGNPTVGTPTYDPSLDNYQLLFWVMGGFVILMGLLSLVLMKDAPGLKENKDGSFKHQLFSVFDFKKLKGNKNNKEMLLANLVVCAFFIPFNFYFVHMGNWLIYDIGFDAGTMGLIEGIGLLLAVVCTIPFAKLINRNKIPQLVLVAILVNAFGLILSSFLIKDSSCVDVTNLLAVKNIPLLGCIFLIGLGYVLIMQTGMIWVRGLFPEESKGQFEGIRVLFFTLIPMLIGTLIGNVIIKQTAADMNLVDVYGNPIDVPQENLFLYAGILVLVTLIPLIFAWKAYNKRMKKEDHQYHDDNEKKEKRVVYEYPGNTLQREIKETTVLLTKHGHIYKPGYAKTMKYVYNKENAKINKINLKEWIFYQVIKDHYVLQLTIGHVSYMCSVTATVLDLDTGKKEEMNLMKPFFRPKLDKDPEGNSYNEVREMKLEKKNQLFHMYFVVEENRRLLRFKGINDKYKKVDIKVCLDNDRSNEKLVIATPFEKPTQFYLNYKENYYHATGYAKFNDVTFDFNDGTGLIDWGRGIWPYKHEWFWGNMSTDIDGVPFGFNIGWGFGDLANASENMYFYDKKAYKVGNLVVERDIENYMAPWHLYDKEGTIELFFTPMYDNYTENKYVIIDTHCNQVFGHFKGFVMTKSGRVEIKDKLAFIEHAVNKW